MIEEKTVKIRLIDIKNIYDYCHIMIAKEGLGSKFSYVVYKNHMLLETPYNQIIQGIYNPDNDPAIMAFREKQSRIVMKYIDRDEQGEMIFEDDKVTPRITEMIVEYQKENQKLVDENVELLKSAEEKVAANKNFVEQEVEITLCKIGLDEIPDKVPPVIVGLLADV